MTRQGWVVERDVHKRSGWVLQYYQARRVIGFIMEVDGAWCRSPRYATKMTEDEARRVAGQRGGRAVPVVIAAAPVPAAISGPSLTSD
ncbi:MAG: hypothetical protein DMD75_06755 [Candidatus Rokuibacteriota bacterium]|nr:MAG: hypothetical protein DMD75_06755 [Candidatus Rokubacteria bacterium]